MNYATIKSAAQAHATRTVTWIRIVEGAMGWETRRVPRPSMQFGADLIGELIAPALRGWDLVRT